MCSVLLLVLCVIINILSRSDGIFRRCETKDDNCVLKATREAFLKILQPNENIGAKCMDPLFLTAIDGDLPLLKYGLYNNTISGQKMCNIEVAHFDSKSSNKLHMESICPNLYLRGNYDVTGILVLPVEGIGNYVYESRQKSLAINTTNPIELWTPYSPQEHNTVKEQCYLAAIFYKIKIILDIDLNTIIKEGKHYIYIKNFKVKVETLAMPKIHLSNLFNGQTELGEAALQFFNQNWEGFTNQIQEPPVAATCKEVVKNANKYLKSIAIEDYVN